MSIFFKLSSIKITIFPIHSRQILPRLPHNQDDVGDRETFYSPWTTRPLGLGGFFSTFLEQTMLFLVRSSVHFCVLSQWGLLGFSSNFPMHHPWILLYFSIPITLCSQYVHCALPFRPPHSVKAGSPGFFRSFRVLSVGSSIRFVTEYTVYSPSVPL